MGKMTDDQLEEYMRKNAVGKANAISSANFGAKEDTHSIQRAQINRLIEERGIPIIGGAKRYFIADSQSEADDYKKSMDKRIRAIEDKKNKVVENFNNQKK